MKVDIRRINGNWDCGYALDKHTLHSVCIGHNEFGHPQFETTRTEVGEALYQLKYKGDWSRVVPLAEELARLSPRFPDVGVIIPMPPSKFRSRQPVVEIATALGQQLGIPVFNDILRKQAAGQLKNLQGKEEKLNALKGAFSVNDQITNQGAWNALVVDDLFDTGASMEAAVVALRTYPKISRVFVAALTWK